MTKVMAATFGRLKYLPGLACYLMAASVALAGELPVDLGTAGNFTILAKSGISTGATTSITGDIGLSPAAASFITGFGLIADASNQFSTSSLVNGHVYAADYAPPTPDNMTTAIGDMQAAYTDAAGRAAGVTELGAGNIGGMTLAPGVYKWGTGLTIPTDLTLAGSGSDVWIFQIAQTLDISTGIKVLLSGGAQAKNIFWQVAGQTTIQSSAIFCGTILDQTAIVMNASATLNGKALAQTAVTMSTAVTVVSTASGFATNPPVKGQAFAYPSPVKGNLVNIVYNMAEPGKATVKIWNENGDLAASALEQKVSGLQRTQVSTKDFAPGIYIYRVFLAFDSGRSEKLDVAKFAVAK